MGSQFEAWLRRQRYAEVTVVHTLGIVATVEKRLAMTPPGRLRAAQKSSLQRLAAYAAEENDAHAADVAARALARITAAPSRVRGGLQPRARVEKRIDDAVWEKLVLALRARRGLAERVLDIMADTGLRVNDVLQVRPAEVRRGLDAGTTFQLVQKGGDKIQFDVRVGHDAWKRMLAETGRVAGDVTLAQLVSPRSARTTGGASAPYQKVRRTLREVCRALGISERVFTHRFRHTVATRLADATGNPRLVAGLLHHTGLSNVGVYMGEVAPAKLAEAIASVAVK